MNIAILAAGSGTNAEHIIRHFEGDEQLFVSLVLTNKFDAGVIERVKATKTPCHFIPTEEWKNGSQIVELLRSYRIELVVLAGFLLRIPDLLLHEYPNMIINIHPSLLPKYGGKGMYGNRVHQTVVENGETETGITIHYINEHYDEGAIIFQATCPVLPSDTPEDVACKVHQLEYQYYPQVIREVANL